MLAEAAVLFVLVAPTPRPTPTPRVEATGPTVVMDRVAAVVGDDVVLESEIDRLVLVGVDPRLPGESDAAFRERVIERRITELLEERELHRFGGYEPAASEVEERLALLEKRIEKERGVPFAEVLAGAHVTRGDVATWIRRGLALETYANERLSPTVKTTEEEIQAFYEGPFREEARARGQETLAPLADVKDKLRELVHARKLNEAIARWTAELRAKTRIRIYRRSS